MGNIIFEYNIYSKSNWDLKTFRQGGYETIEQIGFGAFATVHLVKQNFDDKKCFSFE